MIIKKSKILFINFSVSSNKYPKYGTSGADSLRFEELFERLAGMNILRQKSAILYLLYSISGI
jgi:hypothetical protein